jgi:hypothetical protein
MIKMNWLLLTGLISFSALAEVSFDEKKNRVEFLEELSQKVVSMNIDVYKRELQYEKKNLPLDQRAENEASLLAEKIKLQVQLAYEAELDTKSSEEAVSEVTEAIEKDLALVAPELREEIRTIALKALSDAQGGGISSNENLDGIKKVLLKGVKERSSFLNTEADYDLPPALYSTSPTAEEKVYAKKSDILASMVSDGPSTRWVAAANIALRSETSRKLESKISLQVRVEFLGVEIAAGPIITFQREFQTSVAVGSESLRPVLLPDGNFDFLHRDAEGKTVLENGKPKRRFVNFTCEANLAFQSVYTGSGGFSIEGVGIKNSASNRYTNVVTLSSRRILVPEYIDNKSVTFNYLKTLCHQDFLNTKITNNMTVTDSLNIMMKNVVATLKFSHPKSKCLADNHCSKWFNNEVLAVAKIRNVPRCVEEKNELYRSCELRGLQGQNCSVYDAKGSRISEGRFEYTCDTGLRCVKTQDAGWLKSAKGKCMPINPAPYKAP